MLDKIQSIRVYSPSNPPKTIADASARLKNLKELCWGHCLPEFAYLERWLSKRNNARMQRCYRLLRNPEAQPTPTELLEAVYLIAACRAKLRNLTEHELDLRHRVKVRLGRELPHTNRRYEESTLDLIDDAIEFLVPKASIGKEQVALIDFADDLLQTFP